MCDYIYYIGVLMWIIGIISKIIISVELYWNKYKEWNRYKYLTVTNTFWSGTYFIFQYIQNGGENKTFVILAESFPSIIQNYRVILVQREKYVTVVVKT